MALGRSLGRRGPAPPRRRPRSRIRPILMTHGEAQHPTAVSGRPEGRPWVRSIGMPPVAGLADAVVHGLDVRRALGLPGQVPAECLGPLSDFTLGTPWPMNVVVGGSARRRVAGLRLVATDTDWSHGKGPEVQGAAEALLLLLYGRSPRTDELTGEGAATVLARLRPAAHTQKKASP
jgi:hypothetical protein